MSTYKVFLSTNQNMQKYLINELVGMGIKCRDKPSLNEVQVQCTWPKIFEILHEIKTVESIKIQIGNDIQARNEKELDKNISKLPFHAYIPDNLHEYQIPGIKCKSFRSNLFHEKMIAEQVEKHIRLMPIRKEYAALRKLGSDEGKLRQLNSSAKQKLKEIDHLKKELVENRYLKSQLIEDMSSVQQQSQKSEKQQKDLQVLDEQGKEIVKKGGLRSQELSKYSKLPKIPDIQLYLKQDKMKALMNIHDQSLHKHGFKQYVNWAPIKESIVAAAFNEVIKKQNQFQQNKTLKIWDPFCGSGTILIEILYILLGLPVRTQNKFSYFQNWKIFPHAEYNTYLADLKEKSQVNALNILNKFEDIQIIGSDIDSQATQYSNQNFKNSEELNKILELNLQNMMSENKDLNNGNKQYMPSIQQYSHLQNQVNFINADFEIVYKHFLKEKIDDFTIVANLPYNERSKDHISFKNLQSSFLRFSRLLKKNLKKVQDVFIFTTLSDDYSRSHFLSVSELNWELIGEFYNGPIKIGLFRLIKSEQILNQKIENISESQQQQNQQEQKQSLVHYSDEGYSKESLDLLQNQEKLKSVSQIVKIPQKNNIIIQERDLAVYQPKMPKEMYEAEQLKKKEQNIEKMKDNFIQKFSANKEEAVEKSQLSKLSKNMQNKIGKKVVHEKRLELVKKQQMNEMFKDIKEIHQKRIEIIDEKSAQKKTQIAKTMLRSVDITEDQAYEIQEKLNQTASQNISKRRDLKKSKKNQITDRIKKIPSWNGHKQK